MQIYLFLANGFEEIEAIAPIDVFRRAELKVTTVSVTGDQLVEGAHGVTVAADCLFEELGFEGDFVLFLPGGMPGTLNLDAHEGLKALIRQQSERGQKIAAICAAPSILGKMGILKGKEVICYPGFESYLQGAAVASEDVVKSGSLFTAKGPGVAIDFALKLVEELKGEEVAARVASGMIYNR
jgi:4-methyl-5(b-hydroxyethyl)-thiazole monophosphate biosynthesis|nr:MAG: DJ-1/PfpI family protein [Paludibacter sp.]MCE1154751.1 DJ-1/PfpI family protein [Bacteroidales bacterium]OJX92095.1 MAG: DJ-1 family protein [Paludibacter sp. 47-17]